MSADRAKQLHHEIAWKRNKIAELEAMLAKKPSKATEIKDMINYLNSHLTTYTHDELIKTKPISHDVPQREMTPAEKAARVGVQAGSLVPPGAIAGKGRMIPATAVSVHQG